MQGSELEAQVRAELEQIMLLVSALTGLPTRWSGVVELVEGADFKGKNALRVIFSLMPVSLGKMSAGRR